MRRKLLIVCIVLLIITCFGHGGSITRLILEDGSSLAIREADLLKLFKNAQPLSECNSTDIDETDTEKVDMAKMYHKKAHKYNLMPPEVNY